MRTGITRLSYAVLIVLLSVVYSACNGNGPSQSSSGSSSSASSGSSSGSTPTLKGWALFEVNTVTTPTQPSQVNHNDYLVGSHSIYACNDCHSMTQTVNINKPKQSSKATKTTAVTEDVPRDQICATCHPFSKYTSLLTDVDHVAVSAGTHCNACHFSAPGVAGSTISGWRWSSAPSVTRISSNLWHKDVQGVCTNCHTPANVPRYPAGHSATGCEACHAYNSGSWSTSKGHPSVSTGCSNCHLAHTHNAINGFSIITGTQFTGADCSACHQPSVAGGYKDWLGAPGTGFHANLSAQCMNCHNPSAIPTYPAGHYTADCGKCHAYNGGSWLGATGHLSATSGCNQNGCHATHTHTTITSITLSSPETFNGIGCENCHAASITSGYANWSGAAHETSPGTCINCHVAHPHTLTGTDIIAGTLFTGVDCGTCHQPSVSANYANWLGAPGTGFHANISGPCLNCHNPSAIPTYPAGHYASGCEACHTYNGGSWLGAAGHANVTTGCNQTGCHATHTHTTIISSTLSSPESFGGISCENCHAASITSGYANWNGAVHETSPGTCTTCHATETHSTVTSATLSSPETFSGINCANCHAASAPGYASWLGAAHETSPAACGSCHATHTHTTLTSGTISNGSTFSQFAGNGCENCHAASSPGYTSWLGAGSGTLHMATPPACNACHQYHNNTQNCINCHTNTFSQWSGAGG